MCEFDAGFRRAVDGLISTSQRIVDRLKGTAHPKRLDFIYPVDYGYLQNTASSDGGGIDVWMGSDGTAANAIICAVGLLKRDME